MHRYHGMNLQVISVPDGETLWVMPSRGCCPVVLHVKDLTFECQQLGP